MATPALAINIKIPQIKVADEVFVATALLTREFIMRDDFSVDEIVERLARENIYGSVRPGVVVHVRLHCVANKPARPANLRMLMATARNRRRLYRPGDPTDPTRTGRTVPEKAEIPMEYHHLVDWYCNEYCNQPPASAPADDGWLGGLVAMKGIGSHLWANDNADDYVAKLREGWD